MHAYTIRNIPAAVDRALRRWARREGQSLNEVTIEALRRAVGAGREPASQRSLRDLANTWHEDPDFDAAIAAQDQVDPRLWR